MQRVYQGSLEGRGLRIGIAVAEFNSFITERLLEGALAALEAHGVAGSDVAIARVPGTFELPLAGKQMAASGRFDAVVCLGCVIRGQTPHFDFVAAGATQGIMQAGLETGRPVIFGVLTTNTVEQARNRAGATTDNRGAAAALAAVEMANLLRALKAEAEPQA